MGQYLADSYLADQGYPETAGGINIIPGTCFGDCYNSTQDESGCLHKCTSTTFTGHAGPFQYTGQEGAGPESYFNPSLLVSQLAQGAGLPSGLSEYAPYLLLGGAVLLLFWFMGRR